MFRRKFKICFDVHKFCFCDDDDDLGHVDIPQKSKRMLYIGPNKRPHNTMRYWPCNLGQFVHIFSWVYLCLKVEEGLTRAASWLMGDLSGHTLNCGVEVGEVHYNSSNRSWWRGRRQMLRNEHNEDRFNTWDTTTTTIHDHSRKKHHPSQPPWCILKRR